MINKPEHMVIGKPIANMFNCGAALVIMPKEKFINSIAVKGAIASDNAVANIQLPQSTKLRNLTVSNVSRWDRQGFKTGNNEVQIRQMTIKPPKQEAWSKLRRTDQPPVHSYHCQDRPRTQSPNLIAWQ